MRLVGVAMQAFGIGEDGVGEVVVLIDEEIHFLSGTFALIIYLLFYDQLLLIRISS